MKKLLFTLFALTSFLLPSFAQDAGNTNQPYEVVVPDKGFVLKRNQVPLSVQKARNIDFKVDEPITWTKFPYTLKDFGWEYDESGTKADYYHVTMKDSKGKMIYAVYSSKGDLIATKEETTNAKLPAYVLESLAKSKYKDWTIVGNKEVVQFFNKKKSVKQFIRLTIAKDNEIKHINFNYEGAVDKE